MDPIIWNDIPSPRAETLVVAFRGWNDAGSAATSALGFVAAGFENEKVASIDPEEFFDFQDVRPEIRLVDGETRSLAWPSNVFYSARVSHGENVLFMKGTEPSLRWRTFCEAILEVAASCGVRRIISLGALLADVPHTRAGSVTGFATDKDLADRIGLQRSGYEGPTGVVGVLQTMCADRGIEGCSVWAAVPHYVSATPNPAATLALVRAFEGLTEIPIDARELEESADQYRDQVSLAVAADEEISAYVKVLEETADSQDLTPHVVASGDDIAVELQRFLRHHEGG